MKFIELTDTTGKKFTINTKNILRFEKYKYNKVVEGGFFSDKTESIEGTCITTSELLKVQGQSAGFANVTTTVQEPYSVVKELISL